MVNNAKISLEAKGGAYLMRLLKLLIITLILFLILILFLRSNNDKELNAILQDERIRTIIHQEEVPNGIVIFYVPNIKGDGTAEASFEARFIKKTITGWKATLDRGGTSGTLDQDIYSQYLTKFDSKSPFPMLFGEITNPNIEKIMVQYQDGQKVNHVKTIKEKGEHIWFVFVDEPKEETTYIIKGFTSSGQLIETIEEESIHLPKK
jgi:peptide methionine sulfoxide reductase MsrB